MRTIKEGDIVDLFWSADGGSQRLNVKVIHTPSDTGDLWYFRDEEGGQDFAVNVTCNDFQMMVKTPGVTNG